MLRTKVVLLGLFLICLNACTKVEPGYVGIKVNQYGNQKGVEDFPLLTGRVWYNPFTQDVYKFPVFLQTAEWKKQESITFNSSEGAIVDVDVSMVYGYVHNQVPEIFVEFRQDSEQLRAGYLRTQVSDCFTRLGSKMKVTDIFGAGKPDLLINAKKDLESTLGPKGFKVNTISMISQLRVDEKVTHSINATIEATQRAIEAENKVRQIEAEAAQRVIQAKAEAESTLLVAESKAKANKILADSISENLINWQSVEKWDGKMPHVTGGAIPFIPIDSKNK